MHSMGKIFFVLILIALGAGCENQPKAIIPDLEDLSGIWIHADTISMTPSVRNFRAQAHVNRDMSSISWFASAPFSGGFHSGTMRINGRSPQAQLFRWFPWQALRKMSTPDYSISSTVKMIPEEDAVFWEIILTNTSDSSQQYTIEQDLIGFISRYNDEVWPWGYPYPTLQGKTNTRTDEILNVVANIGLSAEESKPVQPEVLMPGYSPSGSTKISWPSDQEILSSSKYRSDKSGDNQLIVADTETDAVTGFHIIDMPDSLQTANSGGTAFWMVKLASQESRKIRFLMSFSSSATDLKEKLNGYAKNFDQEFRDVELLWKSRWQEMFTPGNSLFSGCFPVLETDDEVVRKIYYTGPMTMLYMLHTNLPAHKKVFLTGGPRWGATVSFFWDATEWSQIMAHVDPELMKEQLRSYVKIDPRKYFGQDNYTGQGVGNGYVANYWALFQLLRSYITVSQDYDFLQEEINGRKLIEHLEDYALNWKKISIHGQPGAESDLYQLADFGSDPWNLLECVPSYIHIVPSFNAGYVWMMRETAKFFHYLEEPAKANRLNNEADAMVERLLQLYAGNGGWNVLYPGNKKVEVRHVLDFMYFGKYLNADLNPEMRREMVQFVEDELLTNTWMRALSLKDSAADYSDRPDHGPLGAFDGWPAGTIDAFTQMGFAQRAFEIYKSVYPVTFEGAWSQSHELWGENKFNKNARVRIPERGWHVREAVAGIDFSQVLLKSFMGFNPDINSEMNLTSQPVDFRGTLHHVLYGGKYYRINYANGKSTMAAE